MLPMIKHPGYPFKGGQGCFRLYLEISYLELLIKEIRGTEGVKSWTIPNGVNLSKIKFYHSNEEEIKIEVA